MEHPEVHELLLLIPQLLESIEIFGPYVDGVVSCDGGSGSNHDRAGSETPGDAVNCLTVFRFCGIDRLIPTRPDSGSRLILGCRDDGGEILTRDCGPLNAGVGL